MDRMKSKPRARPGQITGCLATRPDQQGQGAGFSNPSGPRTGTGSRDRTAQHSTGHWLLSNQFSPRTGIGTGTGQHRPLVAKQSVRARNRNRKRKRDRAQGQARPDHWFLSNLSSP